jgi:DNA replication protein DnaC
MFDVKYHIQAKNEIDSRREINAKKLEARQREIANRFPKYTDLRSAMSSSWAKVVQAALKGRSGGSESIESTSEKIKQIQAENITAATKIKELLMNAKYPHDYLDPIYSCKICKDTGNTDNSRCVCYMDEVKRIAAADINANSPLTLTGFDSFELEFYPDSALDGSKSKRSIRDIMRENFEFCKNYAENFHLPNNGLIFSGKTGLGKTHLSLAIAGCVIDNGFNVIYGSAPDLFRKIENEHFGREPGRTMDSLKNAQLLVLDDVGAEWESNFYVAAFYDLVNSRMNSRLPIIISTNLNLMELEKRYSERIVSRLLTMKLMEFFGSDIRLKKRFSQ